MAIIEYQTCGCEDYPCCGCARGEAFTGADAVEQVQQAEDAAYERGWEPDIEEEFSEFD